MDMAKVLLSLPDDLLEQVDSEAKRRALTRSALLRVAATHEIGRRGTADRSEAVAELRALFADTPEFSAADVARAARDDLAQRT